MNDYDDEIVDLEDEEQEYIDVDSDSIEQPSNELREKIKDNYQKRKNKKNSSAQNSNQLQRQNFINNRRNNDSASEKLRNLGTRNRSFPSLGTSNFSKGTANEVAKGAVQEGAKKIAPVIGKATGKVATDVAVKGVATATATAGAPVAVIVFIIAAVVIAVILILVVLFGAASTADPGQNRAMNNYVMQESIDENDEDMSEEKLIDQLIYYGYCTSKENCKQKGIIKVLNKLKDIYKEYQKECPALMTETRIIEGKNPCNVKINTGLLLETLDYFSVTGNTYYKYDQGEEPTEQSNPILAFFGKLAQKIKDFFREEQDLKDVKDLAQAQPEYVKETCKFMSEEEANDPRAAGNSDDQYTLYYYQIKFNKYISYLKYGETSAHPNYSKKKPRKIKSYICQGQQDDDINTFYYQMQNGIVDETYEDEEQDNTQNPPEDNTNIEIQVPTSGNGQAVVDYALQFVGNPYVWGGTSLTNGIDCSGFTQQIYAKFGISLPHNSTAQASAGGTLIGTDIGQAKPGDLLVWNGHVGIYAGNGQMVHAQSAKTGIVVTPVKSSHAFIGIYRFF